MCIRDRDRRVHDKLHRRHIEGRQAEGSLGGILKGQVGLLKFGRLVIAADIGLYNTDRRQVFLDCPVQNVDGALHFSVQGPDIFDDEE